MNTTRLNIGAGDRPLDGYINIDRRTGQEAYPLAFPDEHFDEVRASHVLEHMPPADLDAVIAEWVRVLKPGGRLRIAVPDFAYWADQYAKGRRDIASHIMGGHTHAEDVHHGLFDAHSLAVRMQRAGLLCLARWPGADDCSANEGSLNIEGYKPTGDVADFGAKANLWAVLSTGRLIFSDFMVAANQTLTTLGIPMAIQMGGHWGQRMEQAFEQAIEKGAEWVLALDYDTVWDAATLQRLCMIVESDPTIDALAPLQSKREGHTVLMNGVDAKVDTWAKFDEPAIDVRMAHFGLTLIRTDVLKRMPKPWFVHKPAPDGTWSDGKIDDDVNFWIKFRDAGGRLCIAPRVSVGHLQLVATWPGETLAPIHQFVTDWRKSGRPREARW